MEYIIVWKMIYRDGLETSEYYNPGFEPEPFTRIKDNAETYHSLKNLSEDFRKLILKYPEMDLRIEQYEN